MGSKVTPGALGGEKRSQNTCWITYAHLHITCVRGYFLNFYHKWSYLHLSNSSVLPVCSGCRGAIVVAEARSADEPLLTRRCVIMKVQDFTTEKYLQAQKQHAAAILILLPQNVSSVPFDTIKVASPPEGPAEIKTNINSKICASVCSSELHDKRA